MTAADFQHCVKALGLCALVTRSHQKLIAGLKLVCDCFFNSNVKGRMEVKEESSLVSSLIAFSTLIICGSLSNGSGSALALPGNVVKCHFLSPTSDLLNQGPWE